MSASISQLTFVEYRKKMSRMRSESEQRTVFLIKTIIFLDLAFILIVFLLPALLKSYDVLPSSSSTAPPNSLPTTSLELSRQTSSPESLNNTLTLTSLLFWIWRAFQWTLFSPVTYDQAMPVWRRKRSEVLTLNLGRLQVGLSPLPDNMKPVQLNTWNLLLDANHRRTCPCWRRTQAELFRNEPLQLSLCCDWTCLTFHPHCEIALEFFWRNRHTVDAKLCSFEYWNTMKVNWVKHILYLPSTYSQKTYLIWILQQQFIFLYSLQVEHRKYLEQAWSALGRERWKWISQTAICVLLPQRKFSWSNQSLSIFSNKDKRTEVFFRIRCLSLRPPPPSPISLSLSLSLSLSPYPTALKALLRAEHSSTVGRRIRMARPIRRENKSNFSAASHRFTSCLSHVRKKMSASSMH